MDEIIKDAVEPKWNCLAQSRMRTLIMPFCARLTKSSGRVNGCKYGPTYSEDRDERGHAKLISTHVGRAIYVGLDAAQNMEPCDLVAGETTRDPCDACSEIIEKSVRAVI